MRESLWELLCFIFPVSVHSLRRRNDENKCPVILRFALGRSLVLRWAYGV
jgi:hypothetical protein